MTDLLLADLRVAVLGAALTLVFVRGSIFEPLRSRGPRLWRELVNCPLCLGVWVGVGSAVYSYLNSTASVLPHALEILALGALTGVLALGAQFKLDAWDRQGRTLLDELPDLEKGFEGIMATLTRAAHAAPRRGTSLEERCDCVINGERCEKPAIGIAPAPHGDGVVAACGEHAALIQADAARNRN